MRYLNLFLAFLFTNSTFCQSEGNKIFIAETAFAKMAQDSGVKVAFLNYLAPEAIIFDQGKPLNGIDFWSKLDFKYKLNWQAYFVEISKSKDIAYSTGKYQFYLPENTSKPAEIGFFTTVWKKQADGNWKVIADIGAPTQNELKYNQIGISNTLPTIAEPTSNQLVVSDTASLKAAIFAADFLLSNNLKKANATNNSYSKKAQIFSNPSKKYSFKPIAAEISILADLAYVYGQSNSENSKIGNYLRIWKKENRKTWKVVLEIVTN
jgi:ketosteroid isomerase-like protein